jgi:phospholipase/carboxylesterase
VTVAALRHLERAASGDPVGALVFFHGYFGIPEDFLGFLDKIDPDRRFHGYLPEGPRPVGDGRTSWFDRDAPESPRSSLRRSRRGLDSLPFAAARTVLAGWSQGGMVAYALALARGRPRPAAVLALGALLVPDPPPDLARPLPRIAIGHGTADDAVGIEHARAARDLLASAGGDVLYLETGIGHEIDHEIVPDLRAFLAALP